MTGDASRLAGSLSSVERLLVLRGPTVSRDDVSRILDHPGRIDLALDGEAGEAPDSIDGQLLVVRDRLELRQVVGACRHRQSGTRLGCVLLEGDHPPLTAGQPHWPPLTSLTAEAGPPSFLVVELESPLDLGGFVADLARRCTPRHLMSEGWPVLAFEWTSAQLWAPGDATSVVGSSADIHDVRGDYPPDIVVTEGAAPTRIRSDQDHHVLGPLTEGLRLPAPMTWADYERAGSGTGDHDLAAQDGLGLGPVDAHLLNPQGFLRRCSGPVTALTADPQQPHLCRIDGDESPVILDGRRGLRDTDVPRLRGLRGVHLPWAGSPGPREYCRLVVGLAMCGVPLTCEPVPSWARALLHPGLVAILEDVAELDEPLTREVRSIRLRRAAHAHHSGQAWRRRAARATGAAHPSSHRVSVLLPTRRPDLLGFALKQVARQRGVHLELVLAAHGHEPDRHLLAEMERRTSFPVTWVTAPAEEPFGSLLNTAAARASGDLLLKMDDDDWYGPDFVTDLLIARGYSGADVVGTPPEFAYVEPLDVTVRRKDATECFRPVVAGGTMMISRDSFVSVGGFRRMRRYVDAGLLQGVLAAGGSVYRTHGHGYLLRRGTSGHTWDPGLGYFVSRSRTSQQWRGFRPSVLLEADDADATGAHEEV